MSIRRLATVFLLGLIVLPAVLSLLDSSKISASESYQTWPSRTPTPSTGPTAPPPDPGGGDPTLEPTPGQGGGLPSPSAPSATPTTAAGASGLTPLPSPVTRPVTQSYPTSEPCGRPPTITALGQTVVRKGPGQRFGQVTTLAESEVRPIVARAARTRWWMIQLTDTERGWVPNRAVLVHGYIGELAVVQSTDGDSGSDALEWQPTPDPVCSSRAEITAEPETLSRSGGQPEHSEPQAIAEEAAEPQSTPVTPRPADEVETSLEQEPLLLQPEQPAEAGLNWILLAGIGLVLAGLVLFVVQRFRGHS